MKPTYEELEQKCALQQSKLTAINELMGVVEKASDIAKAGIEELQSQNADLAVQLANAESKCRELAGVVAENADLKYLIEQHAGSIAVCPNCSHEEPSETDDIVALYRSMETPVTKVFIAEVGAQAVEACAESLLLSDDVGINSEYPLMREFAAQLRKGGEA